MRTSTTTLFALTLMLQAPLHAVGAEKARRHRGIEKIANAYLNAMLAGDSSAVSATYRDDAVLMPPCRARLTGKAAIEQYYRGLFEGSGKITEFTFPHLETAAFGDIGYATGAYKQKLVPKSGEPVEDSGSFIVIAKRDTGVWKAAYMIYNSDRPPDAVGAAAPVLISPFPALMNYYIAITSEWLVRFACVLLCCACFGLIGWLLCTVLRTDARLKAQRAERSVHSNILGGPETWKLNARKPAQTNGHI